MNAAGRLHSLLDQLGVEPGAVVYLHTSMRYLKHLESDPATLLDELIGRLGPAGTLVLPSFAWNVEPTQRPWAGYRKHFDSPAVFDVRNTPSNIGLVPEVFRHRPDVRRSVHPWWSVAARGPLAEELTAEQEYVEHLFGPGSTFDRLYRADALLIGLGVSLNTTSLAPLVDFDLGERHPHQVFTERPQQGIVVDHSGRKMETSTYCLLPEVVRCIQPSRVFESSQTQLRRIDCRESIHFSYRYSRYHEAAMLQAREAIEQRRPVPWLMQYPMRTTRETDR